MRLASKLGSYLVAYCLSIWQMCAIKGELQAARGAEAQIRVELNEEIRLGEASHTKEVAEWQGTVEVADHIP